MRQTKYKLKNIEILSNELNFESKKKSDSESVWTLNES